MFDRERRDGTLVDKARKEHCPLVQLHSIEFVVRKRARVA
jgi:hypothetical protein